MDIAHGTIERREYKLIRYTELAWYEVLAYFQKGTPLDQVMSIVSDKVYMIYVDHDGIWVLQRWYGYQPNQPGD